MHFDDSDTRALLADGASGPETPTSGESLGIQQQRTVALRILLDLAGLLFDAYGLDCTLPTLAGTVKPWGYSRIRRSLHISLAALQGSVVVGELRSRLPNDRAHGITTIAPVQVDVTELAWDPCERRWHGARGGTGIAALVEGVLRVLT